MGQRFRAVTPVAVLERQNGTKARLCRKGTDQKAFFRSGGIESAHPRLEEGVARHGVLPNQQMKPAFSGGSLPWACGQFQCASLSGNF
ncbi:MAG TPA: hypothetical protein VGN93_13545 [Shinella sp.]|jgi:hypothetical protein|uniref:hypothetical protein n=1 Tax=Shinella sp. TaxID=1870904 RepID=UPI0029A514ED|nr:hypothetical protein [Shinella sp.]MDX3972622.1 hypothetical protein [Shinella sp.]HEV7248003.1 hypothetical protein [Shinella sp.]